MKLMLAALFAFSHLAFSAEYKPVARKLANAQTEVKCFDQGSKVYLCLQHVRWEAGPMSFGIDCKDKNDILLSGGCWLDGDISKPGKSQTVLTGSGPDDRLANGPSWNCAFRGLAPEEVVTISISCMKK